MPSLAQVWPEIEAALPGRPVRSAKADGEPFAEMIRVLLEATVDSRKAGHAVDALRESGLLAPGDLASADFRELEAVLKEAKAPLRPTLVRTLMRLAAWLHERGGEPERLRNASPEALRDELRSIQGIGSTTADAILLNGLGLPSYPVDRATYRILARHGWIEPNAEYDDVRDVVLSAAGDSTEKLAGVADAFERIGKEFCKVGEPKCERCPLRPWLPEGGPVPMF